MLRSITQRDVQKFYNAMGRKAYRASDGGERRLADATVRGVHMLLHEITSMSATSVERHLRALCASGGIEKRGGGRSTYYIRKTI